MKKFLSVLFLILFCPAWAACPIESGESVCTISSSESFLVPSMQNNENTSFKNNLQSPSNSLESTGLSSQFREEKDKKGVSMQGSLSCQFGNCNSDENNDFLRKK